MAVYIPPISGPNTRRPGYIEVQISSTRPSIFAGLAGIANWNVRARAVALNGDGAGGDFALLSLNPSDCDALKVTGTGRVEAYGDIQVNSTCDAGALRSGGGGTVGSSTSTQMAMPATSSAQSPTASSPTRTTVPSSANTTWARSPSTIRSPGWTRPSDHHWPIPPVQVDGPSEDIPDGCPGASKKPPTWEKPQLCAFQNAKYEGTTWQLSPGLYPGGLDINDATFHLLPGIYDIAGGGLAAGGDASVLTVDEWGAFGPDDSARGGVMFYNTDHPSQKWVPIALNGGDSNFEILPLDAT